jgi:hypothetical protein
VKLWKKLEVVENPPAFIGADDDCYYARDYIARGGYSASQANQYIANFKKPPHLKGTSQWRYKLEATERFAAEVATVLGQGISVTTIPTSKRTDDPEYDSRMADMTTLLKVKRPDLTIETPFAREASTTPAHHGGSRNIDEIVANLRWLGVSAGCGTLVIIDDVLTTGAHYQACRRLVTQHAPHVRVAGLFWARTVWPETPSSL